MKVNLSGVSIGKKEKDYVADVLKSGILSIGPYTEKFERMFEKYTGRKYAISVSSGTAGLFLLLKCFELTKNDEVITSPFSFVSSSNVIVHAGAHPQFCDIDKDTLCITHEKIEEKIEKDYLIRKSGPVNRKTGRTLKGILAVDIFGNMPDYKEIEKIAKKYGLFLIEDSCEALGSELNSKKSGIFGDGSVFAFYPNKQITTGEGGIVLVDDEKMNKLIRALRNQGRKDMDLWLQHSYMGYNFRIDEMSSALGVAQMERIEEILEKRRNKAEYYNKKLSLIDGVEIPYISDKQKNGWFVYVIKVSAKNRNRMMQYLMDKGVAVRPYFSPIHTQPYYKKTYGYKHGDFKITDSVSSQTIAIPFHTEIKRVEQDYVIDAIRSFFDKKIV